MRYHLLAVRRGAVAEPVPLDDGAHWTVVNVRSEVLVTGRADEMVVDDRLARMFVDLPPTDAIYYGWPMVIALDTKGRRRVAPLVMTELAGPGPLGPRIAVARDDPPYLNPGLLSDAFFPRDAIAAAQTSAGNGLPFGDAEAVRTRLADILTAVGIDPSGVNPDRLGAPRSAEVGVYNVAMAFRGQSNRATRSLVTELETLRTRADWQRTAAAWLADPPAGALSADRTPANDVLPLATPSRVPAALASLTLNDGQEQALGAALRAPVTVVTGPPGTGKSQLVAGVVVNQWLAGASVLVASTNNGAVDVAVRRCAAVDTALLVRTGNQEQREALPALIRQLATREPIILPSRQLVGRQLELSEARRTEVFCRLAERAANEAELAQLVLDLEGLCQVLWRSAVEPPVHDPRNTPRQEARKVLSARWFRKLRQHRLLARLAPTNDAATVQDVMAWATAACRAEDLLAKLDLLGSSDPEQDRLEITAAEQEWAAACDGQLRGVVQEALAAGRTALAQFGGLRPHARTAAVVDTLKYVPAWACTALSVQANFPLRAGLFDLVVIDEASQCSIAEILPLAYRARRILVVGDPNQLTPVNNLGAAALRSIAAEIGSTPTQMHEAAVSAGEDSAFTAYAARFPDDRYLLDEHYRCHPEIAQFVNRQFYGGALRVLTAVKTKGGSTTPRGLSFVDVPGRTRRGDTGGAYNAIEADVIVGWVLEHVNEPGSLGVVTPFAAQAALIRNRLKDALPAATITARSIEVGTAHRFQGDERDTVLFSLVLSDEARENTARWVEQQRNLVNVAVSRAKQALVVFGDAAAVQRLPVPTLQALVAAAGHTGPPAQTPDERLRENPDLHSEAERRLFDALTRRGLVPTLKPRVEGYELDFAIGTDGRPVDVEVDGTHHRDERGRQRRQDLARDLVLRGLGWRVIRLPAWKCLSDPEAAADSVLRFLQANPTAPQNG